MATATLSLDLTRLEHVRHSGDITTARCPACAEGNGDRKGKHLIIYPSGKYGCAAMQRDPEHRQRIFALAGIVGEREHDPEQEKLRRQQRATERREAQERQRLLATIQGKREKIIARHPWAPADVWEHSPQRIDCDLVEFDPRHFLDTLFPQDAIVWAGDVRHSGTRHANHWRSIVGWQLAQPDKIGPMTTPAVWKPDTTCRTADNVMAAPYVVLDFDGFDGHKPETPAELDKHRHDSLAMVRWLREGLQWRLAAIVWTGSKSIHAWFYTPPTDVLQSLRNTATAIGIDAGLIGRPEHPCRLPGQRHEKTGGISRVLWLQTS